MIFKMNASTGLIFKKRHHIHVDSDGMDINGKIIFATEIQNIFVEYPWYPNAKDTYIIIDFYENKEDERYGIPDSIFDGQLAPRILELIRNEWSFITEAKRMTPVREWINNAAAISYLADRRDITTFSGLMPTPLYTPYQKDVLEEDWSITEKSHLEKLINSLLSGRAARALEEERSGIKTELIQNFTSQSIYAWDWVRAIYISASAYIAGYYTINEASEICLEAASKLQRAFSGWEEMDANYLAGYLFWSGENIRDISTEAYHRQYIMEAMRRSPQNPYKNLPWNLSLRIDW